MKKLILVGVSILLVGCASPRRATNSFFTEEHAISKACMAPTANMTPEQRFTVDPTTHRAPISVFVDCYSNQVLTAANKMEYARIDFVYPYLGYLERVARALDQGSIDTPTAMSSFRYAVKTLTESIAVADTQQAVQISQSRKEFADRLAAFATVVAAADRQRAAEAAANRPVVCTLTGVYVQNTVVCN